MDENPPVDQNEAHAETVRLMELLRTIVRMLGHTNRDIERRTGLTHATTVRYFRGEEPKLEFVLAVAKTIGLEYWEFFDIAYPRRGEPSPSGEKLRRLLEQFIPNQARPAEEKPPLQGKDLETRLEEIQRSIEALREKQG